MKAVWEVDTSGNIIEHYLMTDKEIEDARAAGRIIVDFAWTDAYYTPVFDTANNAWKEGKSDNEVVELLRSLKIEELNRACDVTIESTRFSATVNGATYEFDYDGKAQSRLNGTAILFDEGKITSIGWTAYLNGDKTRITVDSAGFSAITNAALQHTNENLVKLYSLINNVDGAQDAPTINAIGWE